MNTIPILGNTANWTNDHFQVSPSGINGINDQYQWSLSGITENVNINTGNWYLSLDQSSLLINYWTRYQRSKFGANEMVPMKWIEMVQLQHVLKTFSVMFMNQLRHHLTIFQLFYIFFTNHFQNLQFFSPVYFSVTLW